MPRDIEVTISGRDKGGYVFENVVNLTTDDMAASVAAVLDAINQEVVTVIIPAYKAAMTAGCFLLDVASRMSGITPSYTLHTPINEEGARVGEANPGAIAGVINWLPATGVRIGRMFVPGNVVGDFVGDVIEAAYLALLQDLANAFTTWDGTPAIWAWQLKILNKTANTTVDVAGSTVRTRCTALNKRMRG